MIKKIFFAVLFLMLAGTSYASILYSESFSNSPTGWIRVAGSGSTFTAYSGMGVMENSGTYATFRLSTGGSWPPNYSISYTQVVAGSTASVKRIYGRWSSDLSKCIFLTDPHVVTSAAWVLSSESNFNFYSKSRAVADGSVIKIEFYDLAGNTGTSVHVYDDGVLFMDATFNYVDGREGSIGGHIEGGGSKWWIDDILVEGVDLPTVTPTSTTTATVTSTTTPTPVPSVSKRKKSFNRSYWRESAGGIITMSIPVLAALAGGYLTNDHFNKKKETKNV
jgi:hypothetical protein